MRFLIFGDSIAVGMWDTEGGWVARVRREYHRRYVERSNFSPADLKFEFHNLSISGNDSTDLRERIESEIKARTGSDDNVSGILLAVGVNDSAITISDELHKIPLDQYERNFDALITLSKQYSFEVAVLDIAPVHDEVLNPVPWGSSMKYTNEAVQMYNTTLRKVCLKHDVEVIDIFSTFTSQDAPTLLIDGVHPNSGGHALIAEQVIKYIDAHGWLDSIFKNS